MTLNNRYDTIIVGHNYPSVILSKILAKKNLPLLMIDDKRVNSATDWSDEFSIIDIKLLKMIGEFYDLVPLKNIESYLEIKPWFVKLENTILQLGGRVEENFCEIQRKLLTKCGNLENLEQKYNEYCERVVHDIWNLKKIKNWDDVLNTTPLEEGLATILNEIEKIISFNREQAALSYFLQVKYHRYVTNNLSYTQRRFLSLRLLSPRYILDSKRFLNDLDLVVGHSMKESLIKSWQFRSGEKSILLESYEGLMKTRSILYVGEFYKELPFIFKINTSSYVSCQISVEAESPLFSAFIGQEYVVANERNLGRTIPFFKINFISSNKALVDFPIEKHSGDKLNFYLEEIKQDVYRELSVFIPNINQYQFNSTLIEGKEGHIDLINFDHRSPDSYTMGELNFGELMETPAPLKMYKLRDLDYWGQFRGNYLGLFSFFIEAKLTFDRQK